MVKCFLDNGLCSTVLVDKHFFPADKI